MQKPPPFPSKRQPDWWSRNWLWMVPLLVVTVVACIFGFVVFVMSIMKSSDAYQGALARVKANPAAIQVLGTPIKEGFLFTGNISVNGPSGRAEMAIPVAGPKAKGDIYVSATKSLGAWRYNSLQLHIAGSGETIDIVDIDKLPAK